MDKITVEELHSEMTSRGAKISLQEFSTLIQGKINEERFRYSKQAWLALGVGTIMDQVVKTMGKNFRTSFPALDLMGCGSLMFSDRIVKSLNHKIDRVVVSVRNTYTKVEINFTYYHGDEVLRTAEKTFTPRNRDRT
jgi:hypothetical protein